MDLTSWRLSARCPWIRLKHLRTLLRMFERKCKGFEAQLQHLWTWVKPCLPIAESIRNAIAIVLAVSKPSKALENDLLDQHWWKNKMFHYFVRFSICSMPQNRHLWKTSALLHRGRPSRRRWQSLWDTLSTLQKCLGNSWNFIAFVDICKNF